MTTTSKIKSIDFYRKIPRDLTEASLSGAGLSLIAAFAMIFLFGMELNNYLTVSSTTNVVVDRSKDGEYLRIQFNMSFPALSCEFASVDVSDALGTNRYNLTKTVRKYPIDPNLKIVGPEFHPGPIPNPTSHGDDDHEGEGAHVLTSSTFDEYARRYSVLVVNFYAPWCIWSARLKPSWDKAAGIIAEKYHPDTGRILLGKVDCTDNNDLCRKHHIQGFPSIRIFRKGHDLKGDEHGHHEHDSYYGERDTDSLVKAMEALVPKETTLALEDKTNGTVKRPAPRAGGCRIEGFIRAKKVPGNIIISAHSGSHSFDASAMNMTHYVSQFSFGRELNFWMRRELYRIYPHLASVYDTVEANLTGRIYVSQHENITHDHYLQVVKTEVVSLQKRKEFSLLEQYDYTSHSNTVQNTNVPVAKFHYELSPMQVLVKENPKSFSHFITNVCAIIGGVFTVAGIVDSMLHGAMRMVKKIELGKQF
ncbi:protein disulfide isomerase-like 5-4 [Selaginella moellendorffii]|uniref:protein disulfide isomerase-like 5-4 n=1 Tax=Selaginella moellendorffii TaxID=88036 RepID=UPI000D1C9046|nr:protein disulfide isomerase-like 5-4 [Selaginella moellendorffii]|eukprot:XP_024515759.1 protein disulfide isomerase-like 5-4 [Selaginella moellendorffii]